MRRITKLDAQLENTILDRTTCSLPQDARPILYSDRNYQYRQPGWIKRDDDTELTRSTSRKRCSPDNPACEGFFWRMSNEIFHSHSLQGVSLENFIQQIEAYISQHRDKRVELGRIQKQNGYCHLVQ